MPDESVYVERVADAEARWNWVSMFLAYSQGSPLPEVAAAFGCPEPVVRRVCEEQDWPALASRVMAPATVPSTDQTVAAPKAARVELTGPTAILEANRAKNLEMAAGLRDVLLDQIRKLKDGTLRIEKIGFAKGSPVLAAVKPGPADLLAFANAAKTVADVTYRAVGDGSPEERRQNDQRPTGGVTIILPAAVANGSPAHAAAMRAAKANESEIIDLRSAEERRVRRPPKPAQITQDG